MKLLIITLSTLNSPSSPKKSNPKCTNMGFWRSRSLSTNW